MILSQKYFTFSKLDVNNSEKKFTNFFIMYLHFVKRSETGSGSEIPYVYFKDLNP